jgi:hypothetical protein
MGVAAAIAALPFVSAGVFTIFTRAAEMTGRLIVFPERPLAQRRPVLMVSPGTASANTRFG